MKTLIVVLLLFSLVTRSGAQWWQWGDKPSSKIQVAADWGDAEAQFTLGHFYEKRDQGKADYFYSLAAAQGHEGAIRRKAEIQAQIRNSQPVAPVSTTSSSNNLESASDITKTIAKTVEKVWMEKIESISDMKLTIAKTAEKALAENVESASDITQTIAKTGEKVWDKHGDEITSGAISLFFYYLKIQMDAAASAAQQAAQQSK